MTDSKTVDDILERVRESRREKRCPDCGGVVTIRGLRGEYQWTCTDCDALGIGFATRSDALEAIRKRRR